MRALVTGATGFVGRHLLKRLPAGTVVLSRNAVGARRALGGAAVEAHAWEPAAGPPPAQALEGVDVVFHLAGEPVAEGRWNAEKKDRILRSREAGTRNLVAAIGARPPGARPRVLVSASAVGIYGSRGDEVLDESSPPAPDGDFLADVCKRWEAEALRAKEHGVRVACLRIGLVLGEDGGALSKMLPIFRLGLGGRITFAGSQWMPWVHVDDIVGIALHAAAKAEVAGAVNAVAPAPVTNADFTRALARALGRPALFPAPALMLRIVLGEFATALTASQRVAPRVAERTGYAFAYAEVGAALAAATRA